MILDEILEVLENEGERKAYTVGEKSYTYEELNRFVANLYHFLLNQNTNKDPVIVYGSKEIYRKATFLACSFAGMSYVPIDKNMPEQRVQMIIEQVNPALIIGDFEDNKIAHFSQEQTEKIMHQKNNLTIEKIDMHLNDIYYIIFTSGSTGSPKGVKVTYRNIDSCVKWLKKIAKIDKQVILNQASFSFDLSVADLYLSLVTKSEHFILEKSVQEDFQELFSALKKSKADFAVLTPSFVEMLLLDQSFGKELMPNLKTILFCGETLLPKTVEKLYNRFSNIRIINCYGPTECTFAVTSEEISLEMTKQESLSVGKPKEDVEIFIVDENCNVLENGEVGEIVITGESVSDGYLNENKVFFEFNGEKAYLSGDLGYIKNGLLWYKGRKDRQVKYKGYRMELSDIEENLYKIEDVEKVAVVQKMNSNGKISKIIAFIMLKDGSTKNELGIRKELLERLPKYMCPIIRIVKEMPLNQNGKLDRNQLLEDL